MLKYLFRLTPRRAQRSARRTHRLTVDLLEKRELLTAFTPGNLVILQAGDGVTAYNAQGPLFLNEITTTGTAVQQVAIPATGGVGKAGNQPTTIDLSAAAGNGQLTRSYDGSALSFNGIDSTVNNGGLTAPATPGGQNDRVVAVLSGDPATASNLDTTTHGQFYVGDDNRGSVAESPTGPIWTAGHPNQAGGAVSQGVHYFPTEGASIGTQVSASTNIRGVNIGFDNRLYFSTASGLGGTAALNTGGIFTDAAALPTDANATPANDVQVVPSIFAASKLGGIFLADMNGDGIINNGDRLYFLDDGTVGGAGTGGLYVATWNDSITANPWNTPNNAAAVAAGLANHWSIPVRLGDAPIQDGSGNVGQLRGLTGTVLSPTEADLYTTAYDNAGGDSSYVQQWTDTNTGVAIANAQVTSGTTVQITTLTPNGFADGSIVEVDGVGANNGAGAITSGYNGAWVIHVIDATHFTYNDTNSGASSLAAVNNQGAADVTVAPNTIQILAAGTDTIGGKNVGEVGLRGVAFAPVAATSVSLTVNGGSSVTVSPGTNVTFAATLSNAQVGVAGLAGDTVTFLDRNTNTVIGQATVDGTGVATFTTTTPLVGNHVVSAYFAGGGADALASARSGTVAVIEAGNTASTTTVTSSLPAVAIAKQVTLTATVTSGATGTVSFYNGSLSNLIGTSTLSGTTATLPAVFSTAGTQTILAVYNGDNTYASSPGQTTVNVAANATATITPSANNVVLGSIQTYTATLAGNATLGAPAGTVMFTLTAATTNSSGKPAVTATSGAITLVAGPNNTATATWTGPALSAPGSYFVTLNYNATGATNPYSSFAINTNSATSGVALVETVKQAFTPGNLVAVQRGDGSVNLGSSGYLVFLDEYTTGGTLVQAIALPNLDAGTAHALLLSGQNGAEGLLNRSANGAYLTVAGYDVPVGRTFVTSTFPYQFPRTIARVDQTGALDTSTAVSATSPVAVPYNPVDVVSNDGKEFWIGSNLPNGDTTDSGIVYVGSLGATSGVQIGPANVGVTALSITGGQLYVTKGKGDVQAVGTGLPTTAGQALTSLPGLAAAYSSFFPNSENPEQVLLLNTSDGTSNNPNVAYIADQANGLLKFWFDGTNWQYGGPGGTFGQKLVFAGGVTGVVGFVVSPGGSAQVQLYVTGSNVQQQNPNQLDSFLDTNGAPGTSGTAGTVSAGFPGGNFTKLSFIGGSNPASFNGNENFAGLAFAPGFVTNTTVRDTGAAASNTFTATVTSLGGNVPTGVVVFSVDGTVVGQGTLNGSGVATFTDTTYPTTGSHVITAAYQGDVKDDTSTGTLTQAASAIASGDLIATLVGTGSALTSSATATFLNEYTTAASQTTPVQSITLPTTGGSAFTEGGTFSSEGRVSDSADGHTATFAGYNVAAGSSTNGANALVGVINPNGSIESSTQIASADVGGSVRVTASIDGLGMWVATGNFVRYVPFGNSSSTPSGAVSNFFPSPTAVAIAPQGQLYVDGGAGQQSNGVPPIDGPATIGSGLPTVPGQTGSALAGFLTIRDAFNNFPSSQQFAVSPDGNTIFVADGRTDTLGGILEFVQSTPGNWVELGSAQAGTGSDSGLRGLTADFSVPGAVTLYATTTASNGNRIVKITGGTLDGMTAPSFTFTTVAAAPANEAFRGVALAPTAPGATASTTTLNVTGSPATYGTGVTLTGTVTGGATGWVSFRAGGVEIGAAPVVSGTATFTTTGNLGAGAYSNLVAVYTGDATFAPNSSSAHSGTVNKANTTTTLTESANPVATGVNDVLTAVVAVPAGTAPTGTVTFWDGPVGTGTNLGTVSVSQLITPQGGNPVIQFVATLTKSFATLGTHTLSAVYNGDPNFTTSTGTSSLVVVNPTTTAVMTSNPNPTASPSASLTLTATVTSPGGTPTGTVQFFDNLVPIGSAMTLNGSGVATVAVTTALLQAAGVLTPGLHSISAAYTPDTAGASTFFTSTGVYEQAVQAQPFAAADEFVYRVGDGTTNLIAQPPNPNAGNGSIGSTIYVDEYTPAGTLVQSIILPSADGSGAQAAIHAVVGEGQQSATGQMSLSGDGQFLFLAGYDANPLNVATAPELRTNTVPRSVARIKYDGTIQTEAFTAGGSGVQTGGNFNGVYSPDGNQFYVSGANGVSYFSSFTPSASLQPATATITSTTFAVTGLQGAGGKLYAVGGPSSGASNLVQQYANFPTAAAALSALTGVSSTTDPNQTFTIDVYFTHLGGSGAPAGINTMYLSDDGPSFANGRITKWALSAGGTWSLVDSVVAGTGNTAISFYWLAGHTDGSGNVTLYVTYGNGGPSVTGPGDLYTISDANGWNAPVGTGGSHSDAVATVASVGSTSNEVFRGVALAPLPAVGGVVVNGTTATFAVAGATSSGTTATITTQAANGFVTGQQVQVSGVGVAGYNGTFTITVTGPTTFTYTTVGSNLAQSGGGQASLVGTPITAASEAGTTVTITTAGANGFYPGELVTISGVTPSGYNGTYTVTGISSNTFTYTDATSGLGAGTAFGMASAALAGAQRSMVNSIVYKFNRAVTLAANAFTIGVHGTATITSATESGNTVTITTAASNNFVTGQVITVSGVPVADYNGTFTITATGATTFTCTGATSGLASSGGGTAGPGTVPVVNTTSYDGGFTYVITFSGGTANSIADGVYNLLLNQSAVTFNDSGATLTQSNRVLDTFYRLFGEVTGDQRVSNADLAVLASTFNARNTSAAYIAALDFNGDGKINNADLAAFAANFNVRYTGFTPTI